jgi:subtilisin family serine protease
VRIGSHYVRCWLRPDEVSRLVGAESTSARQEAMDVIFRIWPDLVVTAHIDKSTATVQADAALRTYGCAGAGIVWAVMDSGIDRTHPHFASLFSDSVKDLHRDFTVADPQQGKPLVDVAGHGTHVAGIIAGCAPEDRDSWRVVEESTVLDLPTWRIRDVDRTAGLSGMAPQTDLVSLKVLDDNENTFESAVISAIDYMRQLNSGGRDLVIHGVNMSLGCKWQPREYAAGQSPLCRELDLLVGTGVVAVVSAGNIGAGTAAGVGGEIVGTVKGVYGQLSTITDPGNAACAITVGSVHRYKPHTYGVTFNSSKGPTLDGRTKPDVVAPGERIASAAAGRAALKTDLLEAKSTAPLARYVEMDGTSMAAAHVSGVIAAFLSARPEFIGQPQAVKKILMDNAIDLGRHQFFQGAGLINLMRMLGNT